VGSSIIDAYRLQEAQQWSGGALAKSAVERLPAAVRTGRYADWWVTPYDVPLKAGKVLQTLAVNWSEGIHSPTWTFRWSADRAEPNNSDFEENPGVVEKFRNTLAFHAATCQTCARRPTSGCS
jgi:hypothetical protein